MQKKDDSKSETKVNKRIKKVKPLMPNEELLKFIDRYINNLECVREMFQIVMPVLFTQDKQRNKKIDGFAQKLKLSKNKDVQINFTLNDVKEFLMVMKKLNRATDIFRKDVIIGFISQYDEYIGHLLRNLFKKYPSLIIGDDKVLKYKELLELRSVTKIKERFIENEVDSFLRDSHLKQFERFEDYLKIPLRKNLPIFPDFIELTERRNLFTHSGGIVSSQYLNVCRANKANIDVNIKASKQLGADDNYIEKAFKILFEIGLKLGQTIYRKIYPDSIKYADEELLDIGFEYLEKEDWNIADIAFDYAINLEPKWISDDSMKRHFIINKCIILKHTNRKNECYNMLDKDDWSSTSSKFQLAVSVLEEKWDKAEKIMTSLDGRKPFNEEAFREWPIFIEFRKKEQFKRSFKKLYNKDFDSPPTESELAEIIEIKKDM